MTEQLDASCRVAFAAYLHDLGKLAERARIDAAMQKDGDGNTLAERNKQLYCPARDGRPTHVHAAYTAIAIDQLEEWLPPLKGSDVTPFAAWKGQDTDDSLINAAAMHHKPQTFLQWVIATADRVASGFEREEFDDYNSAAEETTTGRNHYTARQLTLFEQIRPLTERGHKEPAVLEWRYPLLPLSVSSLFPVRAKDHEHNDRKKAQQEYRSLWDGFLQELRSIPESHRHNWSLWLDHFDSLWAAFASAIPSATAGKTKPEVSLYDHSRTTSALATALWRFHEADETESAREQLRAQWDRKRQHQELADNAWSDNKFLLILGDFFGIQSFVFSNGAETQRNAAKLLRGRSSYVALLTECAALRILDELSLPPTCQVINAAGKFLIVAPNLPIVREKLATLQKEFDQWFLRHTYGESTIGIAWEQAACKDFLSQKKQDEPPFQSLVSRLFKRMENTKARRFGLCEKDATEFVFNGFLDAFDNTKGVCAVDGRSPATQAMPKVNDRYVCQLSLDLINTGQWLTRHDRLLVTTENIDHRTLALDLFGYHISFTGGEEASGKFGKLAGQGSLRRAWDYSMPETENETLFVGYARRNINAWVPLMGEHNAYEQDRYKRIAENDEWDARAPKTFEHIARDDLWLDEKNSWIGTDALTALKGDVDNLGSIFEKGLDTPSFAKWASLSRQMDVFFTVYLPWLCRDQYPSCYTVFAGGDDFFLIGPWRRTIELARKLRGEFQRYVADNPDIHFSVGLSMTRPGIPMRQLGDLAEESLNHSKGYAGNKSKGYQGKNAVTLFGQTVDWREFDELWQTFEAIKSKDEEFNLSTGYLYRLQYLADMSENLKSNNVKPESAMWHSRFNYSTWRMLEQQLKGKDKEAERRRRMQELAKVLGEPIDQFGRRFTIPLFIHLYQQRG